MESLHKQFEVTWFDSGREPRCEPNPQYPNGIDLVIATGEPSCTAALPYPAQRCGVYEVHCRLCHYIAMVTTAGRPDDPRSVKIPCKPIKADGVA